MIIPNVNNGTPAKYFNNNNNNKWKIAMVMVADRNKQITHNTCPGIRIALVFVDTLYTLT